MLVVPGSPVPIPLGDHLLDAARDDDVPALAEALADPDIALWNANARRSTAPLLERATLWVQDRRTWTEQRCTWVVRDPGGRLVGQVSLHGIDPDVGTAEMGYWLAPAGRGHGVGAAAVDAASRFGFEVVGVTRIELFHAVENERSCRVALRCGYLVEGTARQSFVYGDGLRHDEHLHGRLATDDVEPVPPPS